MIGIRRSEVVLRQFVVIFFVLLSLSQFVTAESTHYNQKRADDAVDVVPLGLCWEYGPDGSTYAFWSYSNPSVAGNMTVGSQNQYSINGVALQTSFPPTEFQSGEVKNSGMISVNLGPNGLLFGWILNGLVTYINGSAAAHKCPEVATSVLLECESGVAPELSTLPSFIGTLLNINASRVVASLVSSAKRADYTVQIAIQPATGEFSSVWVSNRLYNFLQTNPTVLADLSSELNTDIIEFQVSTAGIIDIAPFKAAAPKPREIRLGTILGIICATLLGTGIFITIVIAIIFRLDAWLEQRRLDELASRLRVNSEPFIQPSEGQKPQQNGR